MTFRLSPEAIRSGCSLAAFETIGSTNVEALERARAGEAGPLWLVARRQTDGRGRRGAAWSSPPGNLAATLLLTTTAPAATAAQLGFVAGVALAAALERVAEAQPSRPPHPEAPRAAGPRRTHDGAACFEGRLRRPPQHEELSGHGVGGDESGAVFRLKWPNDVLAGGAKLAGILLCAEELGAGRRAVAVGIGVNVASAPDGLPYPATCLRALGVAADAETLFEALTASWVDAAALWDEGRGFASVRGRWLARAAGLGARAVARTGNRVVEGVFETIDEGGRLVLRGPGGEAGLVTAGEVWLGPAAPRREEAYA